MSSLMHIILVGAPGVGKGTFAGLIAKQTGWKHLSVGDILRAEARAGTELGKKVEHTLRTGALVSDNLVTDVSLAQVDALRATYDALTEGEKVQRWGRGVLLDGFPRTVGQAQALTAKIDANAATTGDSVTAVQIMLEPWVAVQKLLHRQQCVTCEGSFNTAHIVRDGYDMPAILPQEDSCSGSGGDSGSLCMMESRNDDTAETIERRMAEYTHKTQPVVDFFSQRGELSVFHVHKGVKDTPDLLAIIEKASLRKSKL